MPRIKRAAVILGAAAAAIGLSSTPALAGCPKVIKASGPTYGYDNGYPAVRTGIFAITKGENTFVALTVSGFPEAARGKTFGAHVHQKACGPAPADAGGHYQNPDAPAGTPLHDKEIWLDLTVDQAGNARAATRVPWAIARGAAGSVVIHANPTDHETGDAGGRLLCTTVPFGA